MLQQYQTRAKIKIVSSTLLTYNYSIEQEADLSPFSNIFYLNFPKKKNWISGKRNYCHGVFTEDLLPNLVPCEIVSCKFTRAKIYYFLETEVL